MNNLPGPGLSSLLWFFAVIAMIPLALWLFKRSPAGARLGGGSGQGAMHVVSNLSLAPNQRVVTVEVGHGDERRWLVLGVTAQSISTLHTMAPQAAAPGTAAQPAAPFAQLLSGLRRRDDDAKGADGAL
jgi:flagellar protein FliO/FliZ